MLSNAFKIIICEKNITWTGSNTSHLIIAKQCNWDKKYTNKVYTENLNINLKNVENVEKLFLIEKNKKNYV